MPEPVSAIPITSLPDNIIGIDWAWMGKGFSNLFFSIVESIASLKPQWYQLKTGLSIPFPLILISPASFLNLTTNLGSKFLTSSAYLYKLNVTSSY